MNWPIWSKSQAEQDQEAREAAWEARWHDDGGGWHEAVDAETADRRENAYTRSLYRED